MIQSQPFAPQVFALANADETARLASLLGAYLRAGDTVLLSGPVGAGKTHFARSLIKSLLLTDEDVPSPTFTLVQTYEAKHGEVWHADLYRITAPSEIEELGLIDAMQDAICLIEWPDRLGDDRPNHALDLTLETQSDPESRLLTACASDPKWADRLAQWLPKEGQI